MKSWNIFLVMAIFSGAGIADKFQNIDYDVTLKIIGSVNCGKCSDKESVVVISRKRSGDYAETVLSRTTFRINERINFKENFFWGHRIESSETIPITMIDISFKVLGCEKRIQRSLQDLLSEDGEFIFDVGKLNICELANKNQPDS